MIRRSIPRNFCSSYPAPVPSNLLQENKPHHFSATMHWFYAVIFATTFLHSAHPNRNHFLRKDPLRSSGSLEIKSRSLASLLRHVATEHFGDCTLGIVYDSNYVVQHPIDFGLYFGDLPFTFTQESVDFSAGERPRERLTDKCTNYLIFLYNIMAMKNIMDQDVTSKIVIVSGESPWEVNDFLKNPVSRLYMHLLIIAHSSSRRSGVSLHFLSCSI